MDGKWIAWKAVTSDVKMKHLAQRVEGRRISFERPSSMHTFSFVGIHHFEKPGSGGDSSMDIP